MENPCCGSAWQWLVSLSRQLTQWLNARSKKRCAPIPRNPSGGNESDAQDLPLRAWGPAGGGRGKRPKDPWVATLLGEENATPATLTILTTTPVASIRDAACSWLRRRQDMRLFGRLAFLVTTNWSILANYHLKQRKVRRPIVALNYMSAAGN